MRFGQRSPQDDTAFRDPRDTHDPREQRDEPRTLRSLIAGVQPAARVGGRTGAAHRAVQLEAVPEIVSATEPAAEA